MNPESVFCPNIDCAARGRRGVGNISIHSQKEQRYNCDVCQETFAATKGTIFYRLKTDPMVVMVVITLLAHGCPIQAIVAAYGFDERTIKNWWQRAGAHCQKVHEHMVGQSRFDLGQVQADEIKVKMQGGSVWMALAMMVSTRLWLGGAISTRRDQALIQQLTDRVFVDADDPPGAAQRISFSQSAHGDSVNSFFAAHFKVSCPVSGRESAIAHVTYQSGNASIVPTPHQVMTKTTHTVVRTPFVGTIACRKLHL